MNPARREAALRVRTLHPPLATLFAALRADLGMPPRPAAPVPAPAPAHVPAHVPAPTPAPAPVAGPDPLADLAATLHAAARSAAADARAAGLPGDADVPPPVLDHLLAPYAGTVAAVRDAGTPPPPPDPALVARATAVARSAGVVAAAAGTGWRVIQRFGDPYCPRPGCYGRDGSELDAARIEAEGLPPFDDGCNCRAEAAPPG